MLLFRWFIVLLRNKRSCQNGFQLLAAKAAPVSVLQGPGVLQLKLHHFFSMSRRPQVGEEPLA